MSLGELYDASAMQTLIRGVMGCRIFCGFIVVFCRFSTGFMLVSWGLRVGFQV